MEIDFQDGNHGSPLGFSIRTILAVFDLQVTLILPIKYQVNWPFISGEAAQNSFQGGGHGSHLVFQIGMILAIFHLQVAPILPILSRPFGIAKRAFRSEIQDGRYGIHL